MVRLQIIQPEANFTSRLHKSPQVSTVCLLATLQTSRSIGGATQLPSPLSGCLTGQSRVDARGVVWQHLHSISVARAPTTITPAAAALRIGRCLVLCWGRSSNTLISIPATCSRLLQTGFYSFSVAELFCSRKIWQKLFFPLQNNIFK